MFDGYYGYYFNEPVGRVNLLRGYDVTSNSFNINQADLMIERLPTSANRVAAQTTAELGLVYWWGTEQGAW